jgi:hypothetical protein
MPENETLAGILSNLASARSLGKNRSLIQETLTTLSIDTAVSSNNALDAEEPKGNFMRPIMKYIQSGELVSDPKETLSLVSSKRTL